MNEKRKNVKKILVRMLITNSLLLGSIGFFLRYSSGIIQEPNAFVIIPTTMYLEISGKGMAKVPFSGDEYITTRRESFLQFMAENGYSFADQMGAGYFLKKTQSDRYIATSRQFTRHYQLWRLNKY